MAPMKVACLKGELLSSAATSRQIWFLLAMSSKGGSLKMIEGRVILCRA